MKNWQAIFFILALGVLGFVIGRIYAKPTGEVNIPGGSVHKYSDKKTGEFKYFGGNRGNTPMWFRTRKAAKAMGKKTGVYVLINGNWTWMSTQEDWE